MAQRHKMGSMIKTKPNKAKSVATLTKQLDTVFADFVKLRYADHRGNVMCFITNKKIYWKEADAAHFYPRQHMGTRWDEMNVHACTVESNRYDKEHMKQYDAAMLMKYTLDQLAGLGSRKMSLMKFTAGELSDMIEVYKEQVKKLRKEKGL